MLGSCLCQKQQRGSNAALFSLAPSSVHCGSNSRRVLADPFLCAFFFVCFVYRSTGLGRSRQGGHPAGTPSGGAEDLCKEEEAPQTAHVPQDADEDH